jgi:hypothetical protein
MAPRFKGEHPNHPPTRWSEGTWRASNSPCQREECGLPLPLSVNETFALRLPIAVGVKINHHRAVFVGKLYAYAKRPCRCSGKAFLSGLKKQTPTLSNYIFAIVVFCNSGDLTVGFENDAHRSVTLTFLKK